MYRIELLPAGHGDCILIQYGEASTPNYVMIDGGTPGSAYNLKRRLQALPPGSQIELFIVTHIDLDHIGGAIELLKDTDLPVSFGDVWFNGWGQIAPLDMLGPNHGVSLTSLIEERSLTHNRAFNGETVVVPSDGPLPTYVLPGGMRLTLISPTWSELVALRREWNHVVSPEPLVDPRPLPSLNMLGGPSLRELSRRPFVADRSAANGSSIAVVAEFENKRCLFAADAFESVLRRGIIRMAAVDATLRLRLDAFKIPHHASKANVSSQLIESVDCHRFLISTNGDFHRHPDAEGIARVIACSSGPAELYFNYESESTKPWREKDWLGQYCFRSWYPLPGESQYVDL